MKVMLGVWIEPEARRDSAGRVLEDLPAGGGEPARDRGRRPPGRRVPGDRRSRVCVGNETQVSWSAHRVPARRCSSATLREVARAHDGAGHDAPTTSTSGTSPRPRAGARSSTSSSPTSTRCGTASQLEDALAWTRSRPTRDPCAAHPDRTVVLGETGWATQQTHRGRAGHADEGRRWARPSRRRSTPPLAAWAERERVADVLLRGLRRELEGRRAPRRGREALGPLPRRPDAQAGAGRDGATAAMPSAPRPDRLGARAPAPHARAGDPTGGFVALDGEAYYRIAGCDRMPPFLMSLASDTDLWMFVTSGGGLTAGRRRRGRQPLPLRDGRQAARRAPPHRPGHAAARAARAGRPASCGSRSPRAPAEDPRIERNLYKNVLGNRLVFEEVHHGLGLAFRYRWAASDEFGLVRTATLENLGRPRPSVELLDGLRNVLPWGAPLALYQQSSSPRGRLQADRPATRRRGWRIFSLTTEITDRPEAAEELRANVGLVPRAARAARSSLSLDAVAAFRRGEPVPRARRADRARAATTSSRRRSSWRRGERGRWHVVADVGRGHVQVAALRARLRAGGGPRRARSRPACDEADENLRRDRGQRRRPAAHRPRRGDRPPLRQRPVQQHARRRLRAEPRRAHRRLADFVATRNRAARRRGTRPLLDALPAQDPVGGAAPHRRPSGRTPTCCGSDLRVPAPLLRPPPRRPEPALEPLLHPGAGTADGGRALRYEGNWRDIFQNWEALCASFPAFLPGVDRPVRQRLHGGRLQSVPHRRATASTGRCSTRATPGATSATGATTRSSTCSASSRRSERFAPGTLEGLLEREIFCYADVPYRLKPYAEIVADPRATIIFDTELAARIDERVAAVGTDGKLVRDRDGARPPRQPAREAAGPRALQALQPRPRRRHLDEHPAARVERRQQRAGRQRRLDGHALPPAPLPRASSSGCSSAPGDARPPVSARGGRRGSGGCTRVLLEHRPAAGAGRAGRPRAAAVDGRAGRGVLRLPRGRLRARVLRPQGRAAAARGRRVLPLRPRAPGPRHPRQPSRGRPLPLLQPARVRAGRRAAPRLRRLDEMLEGQVAALGSGVVDPPEAVAAARGPVREPPVPARPAQLPALSREASCRRSSSATACPRTGVRAVPLLRRAAGGGRAPRCWSATPTACAASRATCANAPRSRRGAGPARRTGALARDGGARTGRRCSTCSRRSSVTTPSPAAPARMYAYEGLGCVYWHMVAKLLLAVQEVALRAEREGRPAPVREALARGLLPHPRRARVREDGGGVRRLPHGPLLAHAGARRRAAAGDDGTGEGGDPHPLRRAGRHGGGRPRGLPPDAAAAARVPARARRLSLLRRRRRAPVDRRPGGRAGLQLLPGAGRVRVVRGRGLGARHAARRDRPPRGPASGSTRTRAARCCRGTAPSPAWTWASPRACSAPPDAAVVAQSIAPQQLASQSPPGLHNLLHP